MITRQEAISQGLKHYNGKHCKHCNGNLRFVTNYDCVQCSTKRFKKEYSVKYSKTERGKLTSAKAMENAKRTGARKRHLADYDGRNRDKKLKHYRDNKDQYRDSDLKRKYGIGIEEYNAMLESQGYQCAICEKSVPESPKRHWHIDHCHNTGDIRGVLCSNCNTGLGQFKDNVQNLKKAIKYLNG